MKRCNPIRLVVVLVAATAGCFPTRSQELACTETSDCNGIAGEPRVCDQGYCVTRSSGIDAPPGENIDAEPSEQCAIEWPGVTSQFDPCAIPAHNGMDINLSQPGTYTLDTGNGTILGPGGVAVAVSTAQLGTTAQVVSVKSFTVASGVILRVIGPDPLILASWSTITINGTIDGSSGVLGAGPGAALTAAPHCVTPATSGGLDGDGDGGGGGGGYQGAGGAGGTGGNGDDGTPGAAGAAHAAPALAAGCPGAIGSTRATAGAGGAGGGAVWLAAKDSITIAAGGVVTAGGAGGQGATDNVAGGGGGGSGGMLGIEAPTVTNSGILAANGGGGGQGHDNNDDGTPGSPGNPNATTAALGGGQPANNGDAGGRGGSGSVAGTLAGVAGNQGNNGNGDTGGGGGGGGGAGYVIFVGAAPSGTVSPAAITRPAP